MDTYRLDDYAKTVIDNFCSLVKHTGSQKAIIVTLRCPANDSNGFSGHITSKHALVLARALKERGIKESQIEMREVQITKGFCEEAMYLIQDSEKDGAFAGD